MHLRFSKLRSRGTPAAVKAAPPTLPVLTAGVSSANQGYSAGIPEVTGGAFGSLSNTAAPGGRLISALYYDGADTITYIVLDGTTHVAFLTGLQIWINGTGYTCTIPATAGGVSFARVSLAQLFTSPSAYTVSFVAP